MFSSNPNRSTRAIALFVSIASLLNASAMWASESRWVVGFGADYASDFPGSDARTVGPNVIVERLDGDEVFFTDLQSGPRINFLSGDQGIKAGLALNFDRGRDSSDLPATLQSLDEVDFSLQLGGFASWRPEAFGVRVDAVKSLGGGGHGGWLISPALEWFGADDQAWRWNATLGLDWASESYHDAFFSVRPAQANPALAAFDADSGVSSGFAKLGLAIDLSERWVISSAVGVRHWLGDAADSPIIALGRKTEPQAELGLAYVFE